MAEDWFVKHVADGVMALHGVEVPGEGYEICQ